MARTVYVAMAYEDRSGRHEIGEQVTFEDDTPQRFAALERLVSFGILSFEPITPAPEPEPEQPPEPEPEKTPRRRARRQS